MASMRRALNNRTIVVFVIACLLVIHLLMVHGHEDSSATLQACIVLLVSLTFALAIGVMGASPGLSIPVLVATDPVDQSWGVSRLLPVDSKTVMRH